MSRGVYIVLASILWIQNAPAQDKDQRPVLRIAYFVPSDRQPIANRVERLDRVMTEVQKFYREGMVQNGYGPMTFQLDRNSDGSLRIFQINGRHPMRDYGRNDSSKVRQEVKEALAREGISMDRETVVVFELLLEWRDGKAVEVGPYVGGGGTTSGTAWVYDDERLDPRLLSSKKPGGFYNRPCSLGEFNSHYIGGLAHELGHGLGLPHDCERNDERRAKGKSLMGGGNHTYGQERRNEGRGTFFSAASAMMLSRHPLFTGRRPAPQRDGPCKLSELQAVFAGGKLRLDGRLESQPPAFGVVAYNDDESITSDYDAVFWTGGVGKDGRFRLEIGQLKPGRFELRLRACLEDGRSKVFRYAYTVDAAGKPDTMPFVEEQLLQPAIAAYATGDHARLQTLIRSAQSSAPAIQRKMKHLLALLQPPQRIPPAAVPAQQKTVSIAQLALENAKVGWGQPFRDRVLTEGDGSPLLLVGGEFFESGLYAHAPARHVLRLGRKWKTFQSGYGLQDGHGGSVVFVVKGDSKELFRSPLVRDTKRHDLRVDVSGVDVLELLVEDGGDGANSDWGVWVAMQLSR